VGETTGDSSAARHGGGGRLGQVGGGGVRVACWFAIGIDGGNVGGGGSGGSELLGGRGAARARRDGSAAGVSIGIG
jgi:hypothetical protein